MKIVLINTDPMVAKLIEATAKKTGITLISYISTDECDVSTLTKEYFVFVDESGLGQDRDRVKSIAQDFLSCMLYAKTKAIKEFSYLVKKPFLPTEILDILQAELLKVGQDLHNASEVTQDEIAQVDDSVQMPELDMSALDKLGDFDITQEFDDVSALPSLPDSLDLSNVSEKSTTQAAQEIDEQNIGQEDSGEDTKSSSASDVGAMIDEMSNGRNEVNFLEDGDMEDLDVGALDELGGDKPSADVAANDSSDEIPLDLGNLGDLSLDSGQDLAESAVDSAKPIDLGDEAQDVQETDQDTLENILESNDLEPNVAKDTGEAVDKIGDEIAQNTPDPLGLSIADSSAKTLEQDKVQSLESSESSSKESDLDDLGMVDNLVSDTALDNGDSQKGDTQADMQENLELNDEIIGDEILEFGVDIDERFADSLEADEEQETESKETQTQEVIAEIDQDSSHKQAQNLAEEDSADIKEASELNGKDSLESNQECEILPQDEVELVKTLLDDSKEGVDSTAAQEMQDVETQEQDTDAKDSLQEQETQQPQDMQELESNQEATATDHDMALGEEEFADIELDDLAQVEQAEESSADMQEDYLQLSESEICEALGEDLPTSEQAIESSLAESTDPQDPLQDPLSDMSDDLKLESSQDEPSADLVKSADIESSQGKLDSSAQDLVAQESVLDSIEQGVQDDLPISLEVGTDIEGLQEADMQEQSVQEDLQGVQEEADMQEHDLQASTLESSDESSHKDIDKNLAEELIGQGLEDIAELESMQDSSALAQESQDLMLQNSELAGDLGESGVEDSSEDSSALQDSSALTGGLDSMVAHDLQELEEAQEEQEEIQDQATLDDLGEFGSSLQAINALRDEMQSLGDLDPFAKSNERKSRDNALGSTENTHADNRSDGSTQANQTQAQLFSELLANKSAQEIRSLLNGAKISINISFADTYDK